MMSGGLAHDAGQAEEDPCDDAENAIGRTMLTMVFHLGAEGVELRSSLGTSLSIGGPHDRGRGEGELQVTAKGTR